MASSVILYNSDSHIFNVLITTTSIQIMYQPNGMAGKSLGRADLRFYLK